MLGSILRDRPYHDLPRSRIPVAEIRVQRNPSPQIALPVDLRQVLPADPHRIEQAPPRRDVDVRGTEPFIRAAVGVGERRERVRLAEAVQILINMLLPKLPYEKVCFDQITIDDGQMELGGYGR